MCGGFPGGAVVKNPPANVGDGRDTGLILEFERSPEVENGNPFWYSCLENPIDEETSDLRGSKESGTTEHLSTHMHVWRQRIHQKYLYLPHNVSMNLKLL